MRPRLAILVAASSLFSLADGRLVAAQDRGLKAVVITFPDEGGTVEQAEQLEGRFKAEKGWPVVFVQPLTGANQPWWIQAPVETVSGGNFATQVIFGAEGTRPRTKFRIVVVLAASREDAAKYERGTTRRTLPPGLPRSEPVIVVRADGDSRQLETYPRAITFAGRAWMVKVGDRKLGPGLNFFSDAEENVSVDRDGQLHLTITHDEDIWQCAEIMAKESMGYGEYRWVITGDLPVLDPQVVLGLFLYEDENREIDFELARWGDAHKANAQFVVQPYTEKGSLFRFDAGTATTLTCSLLWDEKLVHARCWIGEDRSRKPLADWKYTGRRVPRPGGERARANLWLYDGKAPRATARQEVIVRSFVFVPAGPGTTDHDGP